MNREEGIWDKGKGIKDMGLGIRDYRLYIVDMEIGIWDRSKIYSIQIPYWYQACNFLMRLIPDPFHIDPILIWILDNLNGIRDKSL